MNSIGGGTTAKTSTSYSFDIVNRSGSYSGSYSSSDMVLGVLVTCLAGYVFR